MPTHLSVRGRDLIIDYAGELDDRCHSAPSSTCFTCFPRLTSFSFLFEKIRSEVSTIVDGCDNCQGEKVDISCQSDTETHSPALLEKYFQHFESDCA